eukprot:CAMPEP_0176466078 /NCGR_PEP_ID=MMETSP0127-20121128/37674_1 /TAXON_ID=938130 /ORGANISM="Platyophrya macrostoma, Strain WH" /LENGTH=537 /DNA_ID=CAMNT_0017859169 /DNA_START=19 /DNA_END=1632 /DNA_ORIENTATION=+
MIAALISYLGSFSLIGKLLLVVLALMMLMIGTLFYKIVIVPKRFISYYAKQGMKSVIFPGADPTVTWNKYAHEKGDSFYPWTDFVNKNPNEPAFVSHIGPFNHLQLIDPKLVKEFYQKQFDLYKKDHTFDTLKLLFDDGLSFVPYGPWKTRRRLYSQAFHFEFLKDNLPIIEDQAIRFCNRVHPSKNKNFLVTPELKNFTGMVAGQLFFGEDLSEVTVEGTNIIQYLADLCDRTLSLFASALIFVFGHRLVYLKVFSEHRELFRRKAMFVEASRALIAKKEQEMNSGEANLKMIAKKEKEMNSGEANLKNNLLQIFIKAKSDPEAQLKDRTIVSEFMSFFFAGVDTTSSLLTNSFCYLCENPHVAAKIREEIAPHWSVGQPLSTDIINKFEYLYAFVKEVLRMSAITLVVGAREAIKDHTIGNLKIKKGTLVAVGGRAMSFHPKYYKDPYKFEPERFLRKDPEELFNSDAFIFLPFSSGKSNCLGQHLAFLEARVLLINVLMRYNIEFPEGFKTGLKFEGGMLGPLTPLRPVLTPRV